MDLKQKVTLIYANSYRIEDNKTGEVNKGLSIQFYPRESLEPCEEGNAKGCRASEDSLSAEMSEKIVEFRGSMR